eukprot:1137337-Pelagomonas_calceolata.AAC.1
MAEFCISPLATTVGGLERSLGGQKVGFTPRPPRHVACKSHLHRQVAQADLRLAEKKGSWPHQVLTALNDVPHAQQFAAAVRTRAK